MQQSRKENWEGWNRLITAFDFCLLLWHFLFFLRLLARTAAADADDTDADDDADDNVPDLPHEYKYNKGAVETLSSPQFSIGTGII